MDRLRIIVSALSLILFQSIDSFDMISDLGLKFPAENLSQLRTNKVVIVGYGLTSLLSGPQFPIDSHCQVRACVTTQGL